MAIGGRVGEVGNGFRVSGGGGDGFAQRSVAGAGGYFSEGRFGRGEESFGLGEHLTRWADEEGGLGQNYGALGAIGRAGGSGLCD